MLSEKQKHALFELSLNNAQILLYITVLQNGIISVLELSKITKLHRQQIYENAEKLVTVGLLEKTKKERRKYIAANPEKLILLGEQNVVKAEKNLSSISNIASILNNIKSHKKKDVHLKYYEGIQKINEAFQEELIQAKGGEVMSLMGSLEDTFKFFPENYWEKWNEKAISLKIKTKVLAHFSPAVNKVINEDIHYNRQTRYLSTFPLKLNIDIFNQSVLIVSFYDELAIWIESPVVAESYRILFNTLWTLAKTSD